MICLRLPPPGPCCLSPRCRRPFCADEARARHLAFGTDDAIATFLVAVSDWRASAEQIARLRAARNEVLHQKAERGDANAKLAIEQQRAADARWA